MKRKLIFTLILVMIVGTFAGCGEDRDGLSDRSNLSDRGDLSDKGDSSSLVLRKDGIINVEVSSLPEGYNYSFRGDDADVIVDYLSGLNLISDFQENPDEYAGMTWVISIEYENGDTVTVYHFGNMFIRIDDGPWYKMDYKEASRLDTLFSELDK